MTSFIVKMIGSDHYAGRHLVCIHVVIFEYDRVRLER